jgi:hypothetical protein
LGCRLGSTTLGFFLFSQKQKKERKKERKKGDDDNISWSVCCVESLLRDSVSVCASLIFHLLAQSLTYSCSFTSICVGQWEEEAPFLSINSIWRMSKVLNLWSCFLCPFYWLPKSTSLQISIIHSLKRKRGGFELGIHHSIISETSQQSPQH